MRAPGFWQHDRTLARLLSPLGAVTAALTAARVAGPRWRAPVAVICCGNATLGGAGKTVLALDIAARLAARGVAVHCLLRGYGGQVRGVRRVAAGDAAGLVGDEALLLAEVAPTWVAPDRAAGARAAIAAGAAAIVLDDGLQNPALVHDLALLVVDGSTGFGNGRVFPAGPLREPVAAAAARSTAAVIIGPDQAGAGRALPATLPKLHARLVPAATDLAGTRVLAFAGIGNPAKFFATLSDLGAHLVATRSFPDHHPYTPAEIRALLAQATAESAVPVTTTKDAVRLPTELRPQVRTLPIALLWPDPSGIETLLEEVSKIGGRCPPSPLPGNSSPGPHSV